MRFVGLLMVVSMVGCDGGGGIPFEQLPAELASAACNTYATCDVRYPLPPQQTSDYCPEHLASLYENQIFFQIAQAMDRGTIVYDPAAAAECVRAYEEIGCAIFSSSVSPEYIETCARLFVGQVEDGGECSIDQECAPESFCGGASCPGACEPRTPAGQACTDAAECQLGYYCREGTCQRLMPERSGDGTCMADDLFACPSDEVCIGASAETPGECTPVAELRTQGTGEACSTRPEDGQLCQRGLSCAYVGMPPATYECRAPVAANAPCFVASPNLCPATQYCAVDLTSGSPEGVCTDLGGEGDACSTTTPCAPGMVCSSDVCVSIGDNGEPCADDMECHSRRCEAGVCAGPSACPAP